MKIKTILWTILSYNHYGMENKKLTKMEIFKKGVLAAGVSLGTTVLITTASCGGGGGGEQGGPDNPVIPPVVPCSNEQSLAETGYDCNGYDEYGWGKDGWHKDGYDADGYMKDGYHKDTNLDRDGYQRPKTLAGKTSIKDIGAEFELPNFTQQAHMNLLITSINESLNTQLSALKEKFGPTDDITGLLDGIKLPQDTVGDVGKAYCQSEASINGIISIMGVALQPQMANSDDMLAAFVKGKYLAQRQFISPANKATATTVMDTIYGSLGIPTVNSEKALKEVTTRLINAIQSNGYTQMFDLLQLVEDNAQLHAWIRDVLSHPNPLQPDAGGNSAYTSSCPFNLGFGQNKLQSLDNGGVQVANRKLRDTIMNVTRRPDENEIVS